VSSESLRQRLLWLTISALAAACYLGALDAPFVYDDKIEVIGNSTLRVAERWDVIVRYNLSRALLIVSYALNYQRFGLDPTGYHVTNLVIQTGAIGAALWMAHRVGALARHPTPLLAAGVATTLWAVHPVLVESVTYTTGRSETLCGLFVFLSLGAWAAAIRRTEGREGRAWPLRLAALGAFGLAALTKEVAAPLPFALAAMSFLLSRRKVPWGWLLAAFAMLVAAVAVRHGVTGEWLPREVDRPLGVQAATSAWVWIRYLGLWLAPVGQTLFHHVEDVGLLKGLLSALACIGLVAGGVWTARRRPASGWALLCAALFLLPSTSIVPLKEHMAEHRAYQTGLYLLLAAAWAWRGSWRPLAGALVVAPLLMSLTVRRNAVWSSEVALWEEATTLRPEVADAWYGLGDARRFVGDFAGAAAAYEGAIELRPGHLEGWNNLGIARAEAGDLDGAHAAWLSALEQDPSYCKGHNNLGSLAFRRQRWDLALTELQATLAYCPKDPIAHFLLGNIFFGPRWNRQLALHHYQQVLEVAPNFGEAAVIKERLLKLTW